MMLVPKLLSILPQQNGPTASRNRSSDANQDMTSLSCATEYLISSRGRREGLVYGNSL
jgi:hypothetical protein